MISFNHQMSVYDCFDGDGIVGPFPHRTQTFPLSALASLHIAESEN